MTTPQTATTPLDEPLDDDVAGPDRQSRARRSSSPLEPYLRQLKWHPDYKMGAYQQDADKADIEVLDTSATAAPSTPPDRPPLPHHDRPRLPTVLGPPWKGPAPLLPSYQPPITSARTVSNTMPDRFESAETFQPPTGRWVTERSEAMEESLQEYLALQGAAARKRMGRPPGSTQRARGVQDLKCWPMGRAATAEVAARKVEREGGDKAISNKRDVEDEAEEALDVDEGEEAMERCSRCLKLRPRSSFFIASATRPRNAGGEVGRYATCFGCRNRGRKKGGKEWG